MNKTLIGFVKKELLQALRDPKMKLLLFVAPIIQMSIFGLALKNEVKDIRFASSISQSDELARHIVDHTLSSGWFINAETPSGDFDPYEELRSGRAEVILITPSEGLTRSVGRQEGRLQLLIDGTNLLRARTIENYLRSIITKQIANENHQKFEQLIQFDSKILYNPTMDTAYYLVPGVMCLLICLISVMLTSMSIVKEKEIGTFETLISAPISVTEILLGKTIPYFILGCVNVPLVAGIAFLAFDVPMRGSYFLLGLASIFYIITTVSVGTLISTICRTQQQALMASMLFLFPAIMFSGVMFPIENMPAALKFFCYIDPIMYFVTILRNLLLKGGETILIAQNLLAMLIITIVTVWFSYRRFKSMIR